MTERIRRANGCGNAARGGLVLLACGLIGMSAGCATMRGGASSTQPATASAPAAIDPFAPAALPSSYDPQRAQTSLGDIPGDPPAPRPAKVSTAPELPRQATKRMTEARRLFAEQRYSEAAAEADKALRYNSENIEASRLAGLACLMSGNDKQARVYADAALEVKPDDLACHYIRGRVAEKAEQYEVALTEYRTALKCPAADGTADYMTLTRHHLGLLLHGMGFYQAAIQQLAAFEVAVNVLGGKEPANPELTGIVRLKRIAVLDALAESYEALREYGAAADVLGRAVRLAPDDTALRMRYIKDLVRARRFDEASTQVTSFAGGAEVDAPAMQLLLDVHRAAGHASRGLTAARQLVAGHPDKPELALLYAEALASARQYPQAVQALNDVVAHHPKQASAARWKLISIHRLQGNRQEWLWALAGQLAAEPADIAPAMAELSQLQPTEARRLVNEAVGQHPASPASAPAESTRPTVIAARYFCLGWLADRMNRLDDAQTLLDRAMKADASFAPAPLGMAELWINRCKWEKGLAILKASKPEPDQTAWQAKLNQLMGRCYDGLDDYTEAAKCYQKAVELNAGDTASLFLLGKLFDRAGRAKDGQRIYEQITSAHPESLEARECLILNLLNRWSDGDNLKHVMAELKQMQEQAADNPATVRTTALVRLLMRQPPELATYVRILTSLVLAQPTDLASRRALVMALYRMRDLDAARKQGTQLLAQAPNDSDSNELVCLVLMKQLDISAAAQQLGEALDRYPNREMLLRNLAETRLVQQDYAAASALWERLLALKTNKERHAAYRGRLISTYLQAGWYDKVRRQAEQWLKSAADDEALTIHSYLLAADAAQGHYDQYLERCQKLLAKQSEDPQARQWLLGIGALPGQATGGLIGAGRIDQAVAQATAWTAQAPDELVPQQLLLQTLKAVRRSADLVELCRSNLVAADKPEKKLPALHALIEAYLTAKQYDNAIATAKELGAQAAKIGQDDLSFALDEMTISILTQAKRYDDAIAHASKLIGDLNDRDTRVKQQVAEETTNVGRKLQLLKAQERLREERAEVLRSLSFVYTRQNRRDSTIDCLRQALELAPQDAGINNDLGYSLADAGMELDKAERMLRLAVGEVLWNGVGEDDRQAAFMDSLGWLYYKRGRFNDAARWLDLGTKMEGGQDPTIHDHLGDAQWRIGHTEQARKTWQQAIQLHDRQIAEGKTDRDDKLIASLKAKLAEAARNGGKPAVATATAD